VALAGFFFGIAVLGDGISSFRCCKRDEVAVGGDVPGS